MKKTIKNIFNLMGYKIEKLPNQNSVALNLDSKVALTLAAAECYAKYSTACPVFQPWLGYGDFAEVYSGVQENTLVSPDRCYFVWKFAQYAARLEGDFIECGVFRGGTALLLARTLYSSQSGKLWLLYSFEGLSDAFLEKGDHYRRGDFSDTSEEAVSQLLAPFLDSVKLRKGWIPHSFIGLEDLRFSFTHVDVDLYDPALACCEFIIRDLSKEGL